jgi:hypothetical protein
VESSAAFVCRPARRNPSTATGSTSCVERRLVAAVSSSETSSSLLEHFSKRKSQEPKPQQRLVVNIPSAILDTHRNIISAPLDNINGISSFIIPNCLSFEGGVRKTKPRKGTRPRSSKKSSHQKLTRHRSNGQMKQFNTPLHLSTAILTHSPPIPLLARERLLDHNGTAFSVPLVVL